MDNKRISMEQKTIEAMMKCYCKDIHQPDTDLCDECAELLTYAQIRLDKCVFGPDKAVCTNCKVHCYKKDVREKIKVVMRYAVPKMLVIHPFLALNHVYLGLKAKLRK